MKIEEQAAMYLRTYGLDREALQDRMDLNLMRPVDEEYNLKRMAYKESGAIFRGTADHMMLEEWARLDVDLVTAFYGMTRDFIPSNPERYKQLESGTDMRYYGMLAVN